MNDKTMPAAGGGVIYWACGPTRRDLLRARLEALGVGQFCPGPKSDGVALKATLAEYCDGTSARRKGRDKIVQAHKKQSRNGFEVVQVERNEDKNFYTPDFSAKVHEGQIVVSRGYASVSELQGRFNLFKSLLSGAAVGQTLVKILDALGGVSLRPSGGIYWLPEQGMQTFRKVAEGVEEASLGTNGKPSAIYVLQTVMDEGTIRAVKDAIVSEVTQAAAAICEEIAGGRLGQDALENRKDAALHLHKRVSIYEGVLGEALAELHVVVRSVEQTAAAAMAVQEHVEDGVFESVFG